MLALTRRVNEEVVISINGVRVTVRLGGVRGNKARLLIDAPVAVQVNRAEIQTQLDAIAAGRVVEAK